MEEMRSIGVRWSILTYAKKDLTILRFPDDQPHQDGYWDTSVDDWLKAINFVMTICTNIEFSNNWFLCIYWSMQHIVLKTHIVNCLFKL
ncbi:hypothetical protein L5515_000057 [Caenorhabditis briggsae]|uniref:Uncharacterized protein n=1 Tax=Caenorhabditis briggsae TaxID=6238 RepID=A0AAE9DXC8_CAEBR|nr:hypothetical protein L5515_000057 [Caenorhabditis briggsae]